MEGEMRATWLRSSLAAAGVLLAAACGDDHDPSGVVGPDAHASRGTFPAPATLVTVDGFTFFPYTADNFYAEPKDPINLILTGHVDPRIIRAAFLALPDGDRTAFGFPNAFPFDCTWKDALGGDEQVTYAAEAWTGSVIQLACGDYGPVRFHLRLFPAGDRTVGNAHFEVLITGTADHQVLSWELAEQLVTADLVRAGIAAPTGIAAGINAAPYFRLIIEEVYDALPPDLQALAVPVGDGHGIVTDGNATTFTVFGQPPLVPGTADQDLVINYDLVIPKPFCAANVPYVYVNGPITFSQTDIVGQGGEYSREFVAEGTLSVTPIDLGTGQPDSSRTYRARIREHHKAKFWDGLLTVASQKMQVEIPQSGPDRGRVTVLLRLGPNGATRFEAREVCLP
jgi:hypothetical protein